MTSDVVSDDLWAESDRDALVAKATAELLEHGESPDVAIPRLQELWDLLEALL